MLLIFFVTAIAGTAAALWVGIATKRLALLALLLFAPMWLGNRFGGRHFGRVPPHVWQAMVAVVLGVAAISAVVRLLPYRLRTACAGRADIRGQLYSIPITKDRPPPPEIGTAN